MPALDEPPRSRHERQLATSARALEVLAEWLDTSHVDLRPAAWA
jgi:hypothetical protein